MLGILFIQPQVCFLKYTLSVDESTVDSDKIHIQSVYFVFPFYYSVSVWQTLLIIAQLVFLFSIAHIKIPSGLADPCITSHWGFPFGFTHQSVF